MFFKWYTTVLVDLPVEEKEPVEWRRLHVGAERGVNCEHMQALVTNILQRHWEWQEDRRTDLQPGMYRYNTAFIASLDVKTDGSPRTPDGCSAGRNAGRPGVRVL